MSWQKITKENIGLIQQGDKIATGFPRSIINADSKTQAEIIAHENINIFIVEKINRAPESDAVDINLVKTIWSFSLEQTNNVTYEELVDSWWWKSK